MIRAPPWRAALRFEEGFFMLKVERVSVMNLDNAMRGPAIP